MNIFNNAATALVAKRTLRLTSSGSRSLNGTKAAATRSLVNYASQSISPRSATTTTTTTSTARVGFSMVDNNSASPSQCSSSSSSRSFSNQQQQSNYNNAASLNAYPQYTVFGETCVLGVKVMLPSFRVLKNNTVVIDGNKRGRLLLEWTARSSDGRINRDSHIRFALSPEECGLLIAQLKKDQKVEFLRRSYAAENGGSGQMQMQTDPPDKVMYATPGQGGMTSFKVDFEKDGVGGQEQINSRGPMMGPLEVVVQTGELQVMLAIIEKSVVELTGWTTLLDIAMKRHFNELLKDGSGYNNSSGGGGGSQYGSSDDNGGVPF